MYDTGDVRFFDVVARLYDDVMPPADSAALTEGFALAERPINRVVDVGGGTGRAVASIRGPDRIVVDASAGMIERADNRNVSPVRGDARRLPFADDSVDAALLVDALHHVPDRPVVLREVYRILAPGGVFVIRDFDPSHPLGRLLVFGEHAIGMQSRFYRSEELASELESAGFNSHVIDTGFGYTVCGNIPLK